MEEHLRGLGYIESPNGPDGRPDHAFVGGAGGPEDRTNDDPLAARRPRRREAADGGGGGRLPLEHGVGPAARRRGVPRAVESVLPRRQFGDQRDLLGGAGQN